MRNPTVVAATISAVIAAIVSAGTAFWTSRSTVELEMDKVVIASQQSALQQILQARLKVYPVAYALVSQLNKDARAKLVDRDYLERHRLAYDAWDSENGYLLGDKSTDVAYAYRIQLLRTIEESELGHFRSEELLSAAERFELALRSDLGIYGFQLHGPNPGLRTPKVDKYSDRE